MARIYKTVFLLLIFFTVSLTFYACSQSAIASHIISYNIEILDTGIKKDYIISYDSEVKDAVRNNSLYSLYTTIIGMEKTPYEAMYFICPELAQDLNEYYLKSYIEPCDAELVFNPDNFIEPFIYKAERVGRQLKLKELIIKIIKYIDMNNTPIKLKAEFSRLEPSVTLANLKYNTSHKASFFTSYEASSESRCHNIALASEKINGTILKQDDKFSFNERVGKRNSDNGFQIATIISGGKFISGVGGGVCQVSTTLYNAVARAELKILNRAHHSLKIAYVPIGHDAMVSAHTDFSFINNSTSDIYIVSYTQNKNIHFDIYGAPNQYKIELESIVDREIPPTQEYIVDNDYEGDEPKILSSGIKGYEVTSYKLYYDKISGEMIKKEIYTKDIYSPIPSIIIRPNSDKQSNLDYLYKRRF